MFDLQGKTALVTGATGGIGSAIARQLHAAGASVVCAGTRQAVLDELVTSLGQRAIAVTGDLADPQVPEQLVKAAEAAAIADGAVVGTAIVDTLAASLDEQGHARPETMRLVLKVTQKPIASVVTSAASLAFEVSPQEATACGQRLRAAFAYC